VRTLARDFDDRIFPYTPDAIDCDPDVQGRQGY